MGATWQLRPCEEVWKFRDLRDCLLVGVLLSCANSFYNWAELKLMLSNVAPYQGAFALGMLADIWPVMMSLIPFESRKNYFHNSTILCGLLCPYLNAST